MPVFTDPSQSFAVMSIGFLLNDRNDAVIWRGPKKNGIDFCSKVSYILFINIT